MKRLLTFAVLALSLLVSAVPARAEGGLPGPSLFPCKLNVGASFYVNRQPAQAGPWYLYWPLEAHFVVPAPTGYPYWPSPMALPGMGGPAGMAGPAPAGPMLAPAPVAPAPVPAPPAPAPGEPPLAPSAFRPAGYSVPSYWYGR